MVITLSPDLESAVQEAATRRGLTPEAFVIEALRERVQSNKAPEPRDEWERELLSIAKDCGVSLSNEAVSSEGIYE
jgi:hypothetical protein